MDKSNRVALRMVGITMVLVLLGVTEVNTDFNRIVQPLKPVTLTELRTELNSRIRALPLQQVKSDIMEIGMESRQQLRFWWEGMVKRPGNNIASKKR
ncbi:MAG: hypothetical protein WA118_02880 [Carboxydocellales bacterium]